MPTYSDAPLPAGLESLVGMGMNRVKIAIVIALAASAMAASLFLSTGVIALPTPEKRLSLVVASAAHGGIALLIYLAVLLLLGRKRLLALLGSRRAPGA